MKSAKYCDESWTIYLKVIIFIIDPKGLGSSHKIDSLGNKKISLTYQTCFDGASVFSSQCYKVLNHR